MNFNTQELECPKNIIQTESYTHSSVLVDENQSSEIH